jgi:hypothetical protein
MAIFQQKHKELSSILKKNIIIETSMLQVSFYELNTKFEKL